MVAEVFAGLSAFKTMFDMAKAMKDMNDAAIRNGAVIELQEKILAAREAQSTLLERIGALEKEVADFKKWETEKKRYELKDLGWGALAYMLKPAERGTEPPHWVCTNCYANGRISIIQNTVLKWKEGSGRFCPSCHMQLRPSDDAVDGDGAKWLP